MKLVVGVADMRVSERPGDVLVTHGLGSCLGVTAYDAEARVGGMLHVMLPMSRVNPDKAAAAPCMFVDTGVPLLFRRLYAAGAVKSRLVVKVAGGAAIHAGAADRFAVGTRNYTILKKMFWKSGVLIDAEDVGGRAARTMFLEMGSGRVWLSIAGQSVEL